MQADRFYACAAGRVLTAMGQLESLCERDNVSLDALHPHSAALGIDLAALQAQQVTVRQVRACLSMHKAGRDCLSSASHTA